MSALTSQLLAMLDPACARLLPPPDVTVVVDGASFRLHRLPLALRSAKLRSLFAATSAPSQLPLPELSGHSEAFAAVTDFCYGRRIEVTAANATSLLHVAAVLGVDGLLEPCTAAVRGVLSRAKLSASPGPLLTLLRALPDGDLRAEARDALREVAVKLARAQAAPCLSTEAERTEQALAALARGLSAAELADLGAKLPPGFANGLFLRHLAEDDDAGPLLKLLTEPTPEDDFLRPPVAVLMQAAATHRHPAVLRHMAAALEEADGGPEAAVRELKAEVRRDLLLESLHAPSRQPRLLNALGGACGACWAELGPRMAPEDCAALIQRLPERRAHFEPAVRRIKTELGHQGEFSLTLGPFHTIQHA